MRNNGDFSYEKRNTVALFSIRTSTYADKKCESYCNQLHIIDGLTQTVPEGIEHISSPTVEENNKTSVLSNRGKTNVT